MAKVDRMQPAREPVGPVVAADQVQYHYRTGNHHLYENRLDDAIREFQLVLGLNPEHVQAHYELGTAYFRQGNLDLAIKEWQEVLALVPNFFRAHYSLGLAYERRGMRENAITELQVALNIVQNQNDSMFERRIMQELERLQGVDDFLRAVRKDPGNLEARLNLGQALMRQGKTEQAASEFSRAL